VFFYAVGGKPIMLPDSNGFTAVDNMAQARAYLGGEPELWLFNLGSNGHHSGDDKNVGWLNTVLDQVVAGSQVVWSGISQRDGFDDGTSSVATRQHWNDIARPVVTARPFGRWADWNGYVKAYPGGDYNLWLSDSVHMTAQGYAVKNDFLVSQLMAAKTSTTPAPAPAPTTAAPVAGYRLIGGIGQSNVRGAVTAADGQINSTDTFAPNVYEFRGSGLGTARTIQPARPILYSEDKTNGMGVVNRFAQAYALAHPNEKVLIVMMARGGTGFSTPDSNGGMLTWERNATDTGTPLTNNLYRAAKRTWTDALTKAGPGSTPLAIIANHGSTDGMNNLSASVYQARLLDMMDNLRAHIGTNTPYLMMTMRANLLTESRHKILDDVQQKVTTLRKNVRKVPSPVGTAYYKTNDTVHFNGPGVRIIGNSLYDAYVKLAAA
jgi:lysophospholipase L1-like esterase